MKTAARANGRAARNGPAAADAAPAGRREAARDFAEWYARTKTAVYDLWQEALEVADRVADRADPVCGALGRDEVVELCYQLEAADAALSSANPRLPR